MAVNLISSVENIIYLMYKNVVFYAQCHNFAFSLSCKLPICLAYGECILNFEWDKICPNQHIFGNTKLNLNTVLYDTIVGYL